MHKGVRGGGCGKRSRTRHISTTHRQSGSRDGCRGNAHVCGRVDVGDLVHELVDCPVPRVGLDGIAQPEIVHDLLDEVEVYSPPSRTARVGEREKVRRRACVHIYMGEHQLYSFVGRAGV